MPLSFLRGGKFKKKIRQVTGLNPSNIKLYRTAFRHSSLGLKEYESNERLEFLGDAVLGAIIAEYLFQKFPYRSEGYLTELRAKMVSRNQLNNIGVRMGLDELLRYNEADLLLSRRTLVGNALEALIGAVFLDRGYAAARRFILNKIVKPFLNIEEIERAEFNYKSKLLEWSQKTGMQVSFVVKDSNRSNHRTFYRVAAVVNSEEVAVAEDTSKKNAEKAAARLAFEKLNLSVEQFV